MPSPLLHRIVVCAAAVAMLVAAGGCALKSMGPKSGFYVVSSPTAEFYKYGPAQSFGPDLMLKKGDRVTMLERTWGFSKVMTDNGLAGYVASEHLDPAPASSPPRLASAARAGAAPIGRPAGMSSSRQNRIRSEVLGDPGDPLFNVNDVPLPVLDDGPVSTGVRPQFRTNQPPSTEQGAKPKPKFR